MHKVEVVGIGLGGITELSRPIQQLLQRATVIAGSSRHLAMLDDGPSSSDIAPQHAAQQIILQDLHRDLAIAVSAWERGERVVILTSGDPLFFGLGRLLLEKFPTAALTFHPHLSSVQLAFSRIKVPWQDAQLVSVHGRDLDPVRRLCQQGAKKIAILTDPVHSPGAIAQLILSLQLPHTYNCWVCENLGGETEQARQFALGDLQKHPFASLTVLILLRQKRDLHVSALPVLGLPDDTFLSFPDRPGLITKREIRLAILGELALMPQQVVWDIGAGTGSVAIEVARLVPNAQVYAIEKTAMGIELIEQNCERLHVNNVQAIAGSAPQVLPHLPAPDRVFIGGSGGNLTEILTHCWEVLQNDGKLVCAFATMEHLMRAWQWGEQAGISAQLMQLNVARSLPFAGLHRLTPLNPVTLLTATKTI